jgi:outer membrane receptor protein involved in Fe transport
MLSMVMAALLAAQGPAVEPPTLSGIVFDEQRRVIPGASVSAQCGAEHRDAVSAQDGTFEMSVPASGACTVTASADLFEPSTLQLARGTDSDVALVLHVRSLSTTVSVTASRGERQTGFDIPRGVSTTTRAEIDARPYQLLPQVLRDEAGITVQQTTSAHASPIIRGFTGQSNAYLVDGVRLNTSAWRGGPSQYFGWINSSAAERIEVLRGPGSVQYGSDALGGTIQVLTGAPAFITSGVKVSGNVDALYGSADRTGGGGAAIIVQGSGVAVRAGLDTRRVGDLRTGRGIDSHGAATRFLGLPSSVMGTRLMDTSYEQTGGYVTGSIRAGARGTINTTVLHNTQSDSTRYDRIFGGDGLFRSGFEPQRLDFGMVRYRRPGTAGLEEFSAALSVNRQSDGRYEQTRPTAVVDAQRSVTTALGYQADGMRRLGGRQRLSFGAEIYDESITASRQQTNPITKAVTPQRPDVPNGTTYTSTGFFLQDDVALVPGRVSVQGGLRYGRFDFSTKPDANLGVSDERVVTNAVTYQAGTVLTVSRHVNLTFSTSRGFRAGNAADLGSVGLSGGGGFEIAPGRAAALGAIVGSTGATDAVSTGQRVPSLRPESLYSFEPGIRFQSDRVSASITAFDMEYVDTIQRRAIVFPTNVVGQTIYGFTIVRQDASGLAYIQQDVRPVATRVNEDRARLRGFEADAAYRIASAWRFRAYFGQTTGRLLGTGEPLRRMPPPVGGVSLRWGNASGSRWVEGVTSFAMAQTRMNSGDLSDARIGGLRTRTSIANYFNGTATDLGLVAGGVLMSTGETLAAVQSRVLGTATQAPLYTSQAGYFVVGLRVGMRLAPTVDLTVIGENLTDRNYRVLGSGVDAAGATVQARLRCHF